MSLTRKLVHPSLVSRLKKKAKQLQRKTGRPHHELLEDLARQAGFPNWHQLTQADGESQALETRLKQSLIVVLDIKESQDEIGEEFEPMVEALFLRDAQLVHWLRNADPDNADATDNELREFLHDNYDALRYTGPERLPTRLNIATWLGKHLFWRPEVVILRGGLVEVADIEGHDDDVAANEPMPAIEAELLRRIFGDPKRGTLVLAQPDSMERYKAFAAPRSAWNWCLHCERAYPQGSYRQQGKYQMCPYSDCEGDAVMDLWPWPDVLRANPGYPQAPEPGKVYALYGPNNTAGTVKRGG